MKEELEKLNSPETIKGPESETNPEMVIQEISQKIENDSEQAFLLPERFKNMPVMDFQLIAVPVEETLPVIACRNLRRFSKQPALFIRHFQKQEIRQLFHVVAVMQAVIQQDAAEVPEFLHDC